MIIGKEKESIVFQQVPCVRSAGRKNDRSLEKMLLMKIPYHYLFAVCRSIFAQNAPPNDIIFFGENYILAKVICNVKGFFKFFEEFLVCRFKLHAFRLIELVCFVKTALVNQFHTRQTPLRV